MPKYLLSSVCLAFITPGLAGPSIATVDGSVVNKMSGAPIKNAHVIYIRTSSDTGASPVSTDTDLEGHFTLQLAPGTYRLWVERNGFARQVYGALSPAGEGTGLTLAPGQQLHQVAFRLVPLGAIAGRIVDEDGEPLQGVGIQALRFSYANGRRQLISVSGTSSNDRGEYRIFGLSAARYLLRASMPGSPMSKPFESGTLVPEAQDFYAPVYFPGAVDLDSASPISLAEGVELADVDFRLRKVRTVTVRGHLVSPSGKFSSSQIEVVLAHNDSNFASFIDRLSAFVDPASGRFEVHGVSPGSYILVASQLLAGRSLGGRVPVEVNPSSPPEDVALPLTPAFEVTGSVEVEGAPRGTLQNLSIRLSPSEGLALGPEPSSKVGSDGSIRLAGVTPGLWSVSVEPLPQGLWIKTESLGSSDGVAGEVNVSESGRGQLRVVLAQNGAQISGTVGKEGQPCRATVALAPAAPELRSSPNLYRVTNTSDQGLFVLRNVPMTLPQMARIGFASPYHFSRTFREVTGVPPVQFLYALRLDQAKRLLTETQKKVIDICYEVGYTSVGTFSRRFADVLGVSPVRFRKLIDNRTKPSPAATANGGGQTQTGTRVEGHVTAPGDFRGPIAVGFFHTRIPQGQPVSCAVIEDGGVFELEAVPQGSYYLFAVGLVNPSLSSLSYEHGNALRAGGQRLRIFRNAVQGFTSLQLRPPSPFDPPLLLMLSAQNLACRLPKYSAAAKPGKIEKLT